MSKKWAITHWSIAASASGQALPERGEPVIGFRRYGAGGHGSLAGFQGKGERSPEFQRCESTQRYSKPQRFAPAVGRGLNESRHQNAAVRLYHLL